MNMTADRMVHMHCHTSYSFRDGLNSPEELVTRAAELGQPGIGITEHGHVYSAPQFHKACKKHGLLGVSGCEIYESIPKEPWDSDPQGPHHGLFKEKWDPDKPRYHHLTLWVMNLKGWENLCTIHTLSHTKAYKPKNQPLVTRAMLEQYNEGLILGLGCPQSRTNWTLVHQGYERALEEARWYFEVFENRVFVEVMSALPEQVAMLADQRKLAKYFGRPTLGTNDVHYRFKEDGVFYGPHHMLVISRKFRSADTSSAQTNDKSDDANGSYYGAPSFYLKTRNEMIQSGIFDHEVDTSLAILDMVDFDFLAMQHPKPPVARIPGPGADPQFDSFLASYA